MGKRREGCRFVSQSHTSSSRTPHTQPSRCLRWPRRPLLTARISTTARSTASTSEMASARLLNTLSSCSTTIRRRASGCPTLAAPLNSSPSSAKFRSCSLRSKERRFLPLLGTHHADLDGDGVIEGLPGPISPELEEVLYAPPDPETGIALGIPFAYNELCMWSESGAGPTGYSFICADQDDSEFYTSYILDCDENGKITKIRSEGLEPKNNA